MSQATIALVIAQPGQLRNSLMTLLSTFTNIEIVAEANDYSMLKRISAEWQPDLVVLEALANDHDLSEALQQINCVWIETRTVALVETQEQQMKAEAAGADAVLMKGFRADRLVEIIERLMPETVC